MTWVVVSNRNRWIRQIAAFIPSNTPHSAKAITECKVIDCFLPVRQDFVELQKSQVHSPDPGA